METAKMARKAAAKSILRTVTARSSVRQRKAPYSERLGTGIALLYWKGKTGGSWKSRTPGAGDRVIGPADDVGAVGGISYADAVAHVLAISKSEKDGRTATSTSNTTVGDYLNAYLLSARTTKGPRGANTISGHVKLCAPIAGKRSTALTLLDLNAWRDGLVVQGERTHSTVNKVIATLKAALNAGGAAGDHWQRLKKFSDADGTRDEVFTADEQRRLITAAYGQNAGLGRMVEALALTGCRYGELTGARVKDLGANTLFVSGKTGPRTLTLTKRGVEFFAGLAHGRDTHDLLLVQEDGTPFVDGSLRKSFAAALAVAGLDEDATPYALRHTYITLALYAGVPASVIAAQCGTSLAMLDKTYSKVIADLQANSLDRLDVHLNAFSG